MTPEEREVVRKFAGGEKDKTNQKKCWEIYHRYIKEWIDSGGKSGNKNVASNPHMAYLSESFNPCPDLILRSSYRKQVLVFDNP